MNRREALLALTALPGLTRISKADLKPDDVIVIETDSELSMDDKHQIKTYVQWVFGSERKVVVLDGGLKMKVVSQ